MFTPEFRNRLDAIVPFSYLPPEVVARVVEKFILQLELQLADREVHITLDDDAKAWLTERGYDRLYGARPMGRLIQEKIKQPLAEELLFGKLVHGGEVHVRLKDRSEEHTSELQSLMRISYAVFCLKKKNIKRAK